ncbi:MAG: response regulator [Mariprofundales bacterium]
MKSKVLIIDDDFAIRNALQLLFKSIGWYAMDARNVPEAIGKVLADPSIRLVVTDYKMPEMNGCEFIEALREMEGYDNQPKVLMMSGVADESQRLQALAIGADAFLPKPFNSKTFVEAVREMGICL